MGLESLLGNLGILSEHPPGIDEVLQRVGCVSICRGLSMVVIVPPAELILGPRSSTRYMVLGLVWHLLAALCQTVAVCYGQNAYWLIMSYERHACAHIQNPMALGTRYLCH